MKTDLGDVHVLRIDFQGELNLTTEHVPITRLSDYTFLIQENQSRNQLLSNFRPLAPSYRLSSTNSPTPEKRRS